MKLNKPITIIGIFLTIMGIIGVLYLLEFAIAIICGAALIIVGITVGAGKFSKSSLSKDTMEFCPNCGASIKKNANYCPYCQKKL